MGDVMAMRTNLTAMWAFLTATAVWLRMRATGRASLSPLSNDWLQELERRSIRGQF